MIPIKIPTSNQGPNPLYVQRHPALPDLPIT